MTSPQRVNSFPRGAGWRGTGPPMSVGEGYVMREMCDGQSLASPGRWPIARRRYPASELWKVISSLEMEFAESHGTSSFSWNWHLAK